MLGLSVMDERVGTDPIVTHLGPAYAQTTPHLPALWSRARDRRNCYVRVMAGRCNKNNKGNTFTL